VTTAAPSRELAEAAAAQLEGAAAEDVVRWALAEFGDELCVASSMQDAVLVHLASRIRPGIPVIFLDTGYHFAETVGTRDAVEAAYPIRLIDVTPAQTVAEQDAEHGPRLYERDPDRCCALRKVEPLRRALQPYRAWMTGIRRQDAASRNEVPIVQWDAKREMVKVNPIAAWTDDDVAGYVEQHGVLVNPLVQVGYLSIGCAPCTRAVAPGEDPRAGRWAGLAKTECGLHT
jgi:phosphoadenosine phosphosulfate reductase